MLNSIAIQGRLVHTQLRQAAFSVSADFTQV